MMFFGQTIITSASNYSVRIMTGAILLLLATVFLSSVLHKRYHYTKKTFYGFISGAVLATTALLVLIHTALIAASPERSMQARSADMHVVVCDQKILFAPPFLNSSIGTSRQRVYPDGRLVYLGYVSDPAKELTLNSFFRQLGGSINGTVMTLPAGVVDMDAIANKKTLTQFERRDPAGQAYYEIASGSSCDNYPSMINVYRYRYDEQSAMFLQERIAQPENLVISSMSGEKRDCIVVVYGDPRPSTNIRCGEHPTTYKVNERTAR